MNWVMMLAGGVGSRLGADKPKQFIEILEKPVIVYTIEAFQKHNEIDQIEVVCVKSHLNYMKQLIRKYQLDKVEIVVEGGENYQQSVIRGLKGLEEKCSSEDIVLIHWGASAFIEADIISDSIRICRQKGNAISMTPFFVMAGTRDGEKSLNWIDREQVACMASPHTFRYGDLKNLYERAISDGIINQVEPHTTTLMYKMGVPIYFSKGSQTNIKITTQEDLRLFEGYVLMKKYYGEG